MPHFTADEAKARNIEKMGEALGTHYSALWQELAWLYAKWEEYLELFGKKPTRIELLNQAAPSFFRLIQDSLWEDILLHIARLTDPTKSVGKTNLAIRILPDLVTKPEIRKAISDLIQAAMTKTSFCRDWRNRRIAHQDLSLTLGASASPLEPASRLHVRDALSALVAVLNKIEAAYMDSETFFEGVPGRPGGVLSLLYVIDDGVRAEAARRERLNEGKWHQDDFAPRDL